MANSPVNNTAYREALGLMASGQDPEGSSIPSYMVATDTLNAANGNGSWLDAIGDAMDSIPKFIIASVVSGANQIYNIPIDVGNIFGADFERSNTDELMASIDDDLGIFYGEHKDSVDLVGFMASSLVPGTLGIKALKAGQKGLSAAMTAGKFGENTGKALGLLVPDKAKWLGKALEQAKSSGTVFSLNNLNAMRAVGAGVHQGALEALAFETATAVTMFKSPILENQDFGDFATNVAFGAGAFGLIGGALDAAKTASKLRVASNASTVEARPWQYIPEQAAASKPYEKVILDMETSHVMPGVPEGVSAERAAHLTQAAKTTQTTLDNRIRTNIGVLTSGDQDMAEVLHQSFKAAGYEAKQQTFIGLEEVSRLNVSLPKTKAAMSLERKVNSGKATVEEMAAFEKSNIVVSHNKLWGERKGRLAAGDTPIITQVVDTLSAGQIIKADVKGVTAGKRSWKFDLALERGKVAPSKLAERTKGAWSPLATDVLTANARYIWRDTLSAFDPSITNKLSIHVDDIPLMEKVMLDLADAPEKLAHVEFRGLKEGEAIGPDLREFVTKRKIEIANELVHTQAMGTTKAMSQDEIAAIVNIKSSLLSGDKLVDATNTYNLRDVLAMQSHHEDFNALIKAQGGKQVKHIWEVPQHAKLTYDATPFEGLDNFLIENMTIIKEQQKLYQTGTSLAAKDVLGKAYDLFEDITSARVKSQAVPSGAGAKLITAASSDYGTLAASVENAGRTTAAVIASKQAAASEVLDPLLYKLANNQEAAVEWSVLNANIRSIEGDYALNAAGDALEPAVLLRWNKMAKEATDAGLPVPVRPVLGNPTMPMRIELANDEVRQLARAHIEVNSVRTGGLAKIRTSQGLQFNRSPDVFYPIPVSPKDFPHFAMVVDESITSGNHSKTLFASTEEELRGMVAKLKQNPQLKVLYKADAEEYYKGRGQFDYEKTLSDNYLDVEASRKGVSSPYLVATDPKKITTEFLDWHMQRESGLVREAVSAKYEVQFEELKRLGAEFEKAGTSKFSNLNLAKFSGDASANPYRDYIKTALAIKKTADYPWYTNLNKMVDEKFSALYSKMDDVFSLAKTPEDLAPINVMLKKAGYQGGAYDESMQLFANATPDKGLLSKTVQKANGLLATLILRWDPINALNNAVSANVLLGAETASLTRLINSGGEGAVNEWNALTKINAVGTDKLMMAPQKLIANSMKRYVTGAKEDLAYFRENGFLSSISDQYREILDDIPFTGTESANNWSTRLDGAFKKAKAIGDKGEKLTGNRIAEEFNRFVAADVMKQMTDVAIERGLMTVKEQLSYINTFVNRTQGNYMAAQRPMLFHGPIGSAVGLFQTYQFNLMQQLLRHVGDGHAKDAMTLMGLQGAIHGMNGLPAFNAINTHLIGTASGNTEHKDAYDAIYGAVGKNAGDWLTYGIGSNALGLIHPDLKINLYTRGDINPRQVTVIPTSPAEIPVVQAYGKVLGNLFNVASKISKGADISTAILQGLEHNGINRPLAGLAQTLEGINNPNRASYTTTNRGNVIASNDLLSLANLGRMAGAKPMDEAVAIDTAFRFKAYALLDLKKQQALGQAIKTTMMAGESPTPEQIVDFTAKYVEAGGKQDKFNKYMTNLYKTANLSQTKAIQKGLKEPMAQRMQTIMGGREFRDFTE